MYLCKCSFLFSSTLNIWWHSYTTTPNTSARVQGGGREAQLWSKDQMGSTRLWIISSTFTYVGTEYQCAQWTQALVPFLVQCFWGQFLVPETCAWARLSLLLFLPDILMCKKLHGRWILLRQSFGCLQLQWLRSWERWIEHSTWFNQHPWLHWLTWTWHGHNYCRTFGLLWSFGS